MALVRDVDMEGMIDDVRGDASGFFSLCRSRLVVVRWAARGRMIPS